jgi:hypothetical protein
MRRIMGAGLGNQWFDLLQSAAIVAGLLLNVSVLLEEKKARRLSNLITLTQQHRDIWRDSTRPELSRLRETNVDLLAHPVTRDEETFVKSVIVQTVCAYQANRLKEVADFGDLSADAGSFFSLPIPGAVWGRVKSLHDSEFVTFVEAGKNLRHRWN